MAKKSRKDKSRSATPMSVARPRSLLQIHPVVLKAMKSQTLQTLRQRLRTIEDRREWHPLGPRRSARSFNAAHHQLVVKQPRKQSHKVPKGIRFHAPRKVLICVRRKVRREVMFALNKRGKGSARRNRRRNWYSAISC